MLESVSARDVKDRYPEAWHVLVSSTYYGDSDISSWRAAEAIVAWENSFFVDQGVLWAESEVPSSPISWDENRGWMDEDYVVIKTNGQSERRNA